MSIPTFSGMTLASASDSVDEAYGQNSNKWTAESVFAKEGGLCAMTKFNVSGDGGGGQDFAVGNQNSANVFFVGWTRYISRTAIETIANGGGYVRLSSSANNMTTNYVDYYIAGSDVPWTDRSWRMVAVDGTRTGDRSNSFTSTSVDTLGFGFNVLSTGTNAQYPMHGHDIMYYGSGVEVTGPSFTDATNGIDLNNNAGADTIDRNDGGSFITDGWEVGDYVKVVGATDTDDDGEYEITGVTAGVLTLSTGDFTTGETANTTVKIYCSVTFEDIYNWDNDEANNTAPMKGVVDKDITGGYIISYPLIIGDVSGAGDIYFRSTNDTVTFADQPLSTATAGVKFLTFAEDTGKTYVEFGGTGLPGSSISSEPHILPSGDSDRRIDAADTVTNLLFQGCSFSNVEAGIDLKTASGTGHEVTGCTFSTCGKIAIGFATFTGNNIIGSTATSAASIGVAQLTAMTGNTFLSGGTGHAIDLGTVTTTTSVTWDNTDSGYASTNGSTGNETILVNVNSGQTLTINVASGASTPTYYNTGTGTVNVVVGQVTVKVTTALSDGTPVGSCRVFLAAADGTGPFPYQESVTLNATASTTVTATHTSHGMASGDKIVVYDAADQAANGVFTITVTGANTYTYTARSTVTLSSDAATVSFVALEGETNAVTGILSASRSYSSNQPVSGWARKSTSSPYYKQGPIAGTVDTANGFTATAVMILDQ